MRHPARRARGGWIAAAVASLSALAATDGWAQAQEAVPSGVSVRLEAKDGKADYLMGEPIDLRLRFWSDGPGYLVNTVRIFGVSETIDVSPADQTFRWHGTISTDVNVLTPLSASGISMDIRVNDAIFIKSPGTYSVSVTTRRLARGSVSASPNWLTETTNPVIIHLAPMPDIEEARRVAALSAAIAKTDHEEGLDHSAEVQLACLAGDRAARKKVELYLTGRDDIVGIRKIGLALSRNKDLEIQMLDAAWRSPERVPDKALLDEMIQLRHLAAGIAVPDSGMILPKRTRDEVIQAQAEAAPYISEIVATMARRQGENKLATQGFLDEVKKQDEIELSIAN